MRVFEVTILFLLCVAMHGGCAAEDPAVPAITGRVDREDLPSAIVGDTYRIEVRLPPSYDADQGRAYPVVYQLDGTNFGPQFAITAGFASGLEAEGLIVDTIVVGIGYPYDDPLISKTRGRFRDYATRSGADAPGGADAFLRFVEEELIPHIDGAYRTDVTKRVLSGHSLGGFMSLYSLFTSYRRSSPPFTGFIAGDPSLGLDNYRLLDEEAALFATTRALAVSLWLEVARFDGAVQQLSYREIDERLRRYADLRYGSELRDTDHGGAIRPSFRNGLVHVLGGVQ